MDDLTSQQIQQTQSASVSPPSGFQEVPMTGCSTQALTNGGSKNVGIRNRRKAPPRKVVIHERTETEPTDQDADAQSDELFEAGDIFGGQASPDDPEMAAEEPLPSGSRVTMEGSGGPSVEDLQRLSEALTGKMDVQSLLSHMIAANNSTSQQLALTSFPNAADLLQQVSNQSDLSQQMISAVAQQQLAALAAVAPFNPSTPDCSASPSLTGMHSLSSQQPSSSEQQSSSSGSSKLGQGSVRSSKRKLFETAGTQGEPMSNDERIEIEDLEQFAATFKKQRIKFGFTQGDVGQALGRRYGTDFSQTTISRFEAMNLSFKNMCKLRPLLKEWLSDAERALANGASITELIESGAQVRVENSPFPGYSFPVSKKSSPPTFPSLSSYFLKPRARSRPLSSLQGSHFLSSRPHQLHKGPLLVTTGLLPSYSKAPLSRSSISNAQSPSLSSVELSWSTDGEDVLPGKGLYRPPSLLSSHQKDLHKSQNAEGTLPPSLVQTLCASSPSHVNGIPLPTRFRRSPLTFDLHLERDVQLRKRNRRNPLKKLLKAFQFFHPKCQALVHLHEDTVRELVVCANEMVPEEQSICEKTVPELCRDMDVGNEDRIPGNLRRLENVTVEDYDPDANEWSNHTWNGTERPLLGDLGSEWKSFWNNDSWNESTFNNGLTWRGQGGFWEVPGNWMCNSEDYERPDWNTGITDALVGFDIMDQIQELVDEFGQFD